MKKRVMIVPLLLILTLAGEAACGEERRPIPDPAPSTEQTPRTSLPGQAPDGDIVDTNGAFIGYYICEPDGSATYINDKSSVHVDASKFCNGTTTTTLR